MGRTISWSAAATKVVRKMSNKELLREYHSLGRGAANWTIEGRKKYSQFVNEEIRRRKKARKMRKTAGRRRKSAFGPLLGLF